MSDLAECRYQCNRFLEESAALAVENLVSTPVAGALKEGLRPAARQAISIAASTS